MANKSSDTALKLIKLAIRDAGTTATGPVMLALEDILNKEMLARQQSYVKATAGLRMYRIVDRLERMGICTYNDVEALIAEATATRAKERPRRQEEFRRALGM